MANYFWRKAVVSGDRNSWAPFNDAFIRTAIGELSAELYNDGGALKLSKGRIGISNGVTEGVCIQDTIATLSLVGLTADEWAKIEVTVSGTAVTVAITSTGETETEGTIPATVKAAYDYEKRGYYLTASKRIVGLAYIRAAGTLGRIVNCENGKLGFKGIDFSEHIDMAGATTTKYFNKFSMDVGAWNMDSLSVLTVTLPYTLANTNAQFFVSIFADGQTAGGYPLTAGNDQADPGLLRGGIKQLGAGTIDLFRRTSGDFDTVSFNDAVQNRGIIFIRHET